MKRLPASFVPRAEPKKGVSFTPGVRDPRHDSLQFGECCFDYLENSVLSIEGNSKYDFAQASLNLLELHFKVNQAS